MSPKKSKKPQAGANIPSGQRILQGADPDFYRTQTPVWSLRSLDLDHSRWGWKRLGHEAVWQKIWPKLRDREGMTWAEIEQEVGGRKSGTNSHNVAVATDLIREAQQRLDELGHLADSLFSLRLQGTQRIYGIREGRVLRLIWFDENHEICPVSG